jgi:hypothetical protein
MSRDSDMMQTMLADVVIVGGSFGAPAAALAAARQNPDLWVVLLEPMAWVGGQATSQGVSAIDNCWHDPFKTQMRDEPQAHYAADYLEWLEAMKNPGHDTPGMGLAPDGTCWVSRESYDPRTAVWALERMLQRFPNLRVFTRTTLKAVATRETAAGRREISELRAIERTVPDKRQFPRFLSEEWQDWFSEEASAWYQKTVHRVVPRDETRGLVVVDSSETSDAIVLAGADYTIGRELRTEEPDSQNRPPQHDELASQATVFCFCMTGAVPESGRDSLTDIRNKIDISAFEQYVARQEETFYSLGTHGFHRVWTYRRLYARAPLHDWDQVHPGDVTMQNWNPGNDYPYGSIFKTRAEAEAEFSSAQGWRGGLHLDHLHQAELHAFGFFLHMARLAPEKVGFHLTIPRGGHPMAMMGTWNGLAEFPYIRCGRRLVGLDGFRILQESFADSQGDGRNRTSHRFFDSLGIGCYASDVHPIEGSEGVGCAVHLPSGFYIPYRALASHNVENLLSGCKSMAASYWVNSAYRLHPIEWAAGSAAGTAASIMAEQKLTNRQMLDRGPLERLQKTVAQNSPIHWPKYDREAIPPRRLDLIINGLKALPRQGEVEVSITAPEGGRLELRLSDAEKNPQLLPISQNTSSLLFSVEPSALGSRTSWKLEFSPEYPLETAVQVAWTTGDHTEHFAVPVSVELTTVDLLIGGELVIGGDDSRVTRTGENWVKMESSDGVVWSTDGAMPGRVMTYGVPALAPGQYEVILGWPALESAARDAVVIVASARGERRQILDQTQTSPEGTLLETVTLSAPSALRVMISNDHSEPQRQILAGSLKIRRVL